MSGLFLWDSFTLAMPFLLQSFFSRSLEMLLQSRHDGIVRLVYDLLYLLKVFLVHVDDGDEEAQSSTFSAQRQCCILMQLT